MKRILLSEKIKKAPWFLTIEPYLGKRDQPIASHPEARQPRLVPLVVIDYGNPAARIKHMRYVGRLLFGSIGEMWKSARSIRQNPYSGKKIIDPQTLAGLEAYTKSLGVAEIGYTVINPRYIFRGFRILFPNALVFTIEMDREKIRQAPSPPSYIEIWRTYYEVGVIVNKVAEFLRQRGFNAHAGPAVGGDVNYIPVAIDAGLGISGKNGLLITRHSGPRVRLAAVYTDIENLPFAQDNPHGWVRDYCESCNLCIQKCPVDAIYPVTKTLLDGGPAFIDHTKCAIPFSNDNGCTLCIKHCPFSSEVQKLVEDFNARMFTQKQHPVLRLLFGKTKRGYVARFRGRFLTLDRTDRGFPSEICRLTWNGTMDDWGFAINRHSRNIYVPNEWMFPGDQHVNGTIEGAMKAGMETYPM